MLGWEVQKCLKNISYANLGMGTQGPFNLSHFYSMPVRLGHTSVVRPRMHVSDLNYILH